MMFVPCRPERLSRDKYSSLFQGFLNEDRKFFITLDPGAMLQSSLLGRYISYEEKMKCCEYGPCPLHKIIIICTFFCCHSGC